MKWNVGYDAPHMKEFNRMDGKFKLTFWDQSAFGSSGYDVGLFINRNKIKIWRFKTRSAALKKLANLKETYRYRISIRSIDTK